MLQSSLGGQIIQFGRGHFSSERKPHNIGTRLKRSLNHLLPLALLGQPSGCVVCQGAEPWQWQHRQPSHHRQNAHQSHEHHTMYHHGPALSETQSWQTCIRRKEQIIEISTFGLGEGRQVLPTVSHSVWTGWPLKYNWFMVTPATPLSRHVKSGDDLLLPSSAVFLHISQMHHKLQQYHEHPQIKRGIWAMQHYYIHLPWKQSWLSIVGFISELKSILFGH